MIIRRAGRLRWMRALSESYRIVEKAISENPQTAGQLVEAIRPAFEQAECAPGAMAAYYVLYAMEKQGVLSKTVERVEGAREGVDAPLFRAVPGGGE